MRTSCLVSIVAVLVVVGSASSQGPRSDGNAASRPAASRGEIAKLIADLGSDRWSVREAAATRLREIGMPAVPALRKASLSPDLEVKVRAKALLHDITHMAPALLTRQRAAIQQAFRRGDYAEAIRLSKRITPASNAQMLDWLWQGHCCQLGGEWAQAVKAYRKVVAYIDEDIAAGVKKPADPPPGRGIGRGEGVGIGPVRPPGPIALSARERKELINQRSVLMLWIARMQAAELKNPAAAAKTLDEALRYLDKTGTEIDYVWQTLAKACPPLLHEANDPAGAVAAWKRFLALQKRAERNWVGDLVIDVERIHADLARLPAGAKRPDVPWIIPLSEKQPSTRLNLDDPNTAARSYRPGGVYSYYAFAPPAGMEFEAIEFSCDIEQLVRRFGGHFRCFVAADDPPGKTMDLGRIDWNPSNDPNTELGRGIAGRRFAIPPGVGLVHIRVGASRKRFIVHSVTAKPAFRPITTDAPPILADARMQTKLHPANGKLTWGDMEMRHDRAYNGVRPGRHTLRFSAPGRAETIETPFEVRPGRRYGLVFSLDSPMQQIPLALELNGNVADGTDLSIQRVKDGDYLAVWCSADNKLMSARSKDLVRWSQPKALPLNSVFDNIEPATFRALDGTIYLAYFSNRLSLQSTSTGGFGLWLARTTDGTKWSPPRRIEIGTLGGWPPTSPCMTVGPKGKQWIFWRNHGGCGESLDEVRELTPFRPRMDAGPRPCSHWNPHVTLGPDKRLHTVCDDLGEGIYHMTSADGANWSLPRLLVTAKQANPNIYHPQLIFWKGKALLLYREYGDARIAPIKLDGEPLVAGAGVRIGWHMTGLSGARAFVHKDEISLIAGMDTTWLLRAKLADLAAALKQR
ncbi:MAG TPA: hypothetical protein VNA25_28380 [Phycisphaerae bacterium]|nr:hypothetical protein [Phycisphaerae bacterium]